MNYIAGMDIELQADLFEEFEEMMKAIREYEEVHKDEYVDEFGNEGLADEDEEMSDVDGEFQDEDLLDENSVEIYEEHDMGDYYWEDMYESMHEE